MYDPFKFCSRSSSYIQYNDKYVHRVRYLFLPWFDMQLFPQRFQVCNIHIGKQNYSQTIHKVAFQFLNHQQLWLLWNFFHHTFIISKLLPFLRIKAQYFLKPSWANGTRHEDTALLPVLLPVLTISITEHAPHPPSSHICLTSVWPFCRRYESKVSFILIFDTSYSSLFTVNLFSVLEHLFSSISTSSKYLSSTSTPDRFSLSVRTGPDTVHLLIAVHSGTGSLKMKLKVQN